jgi:hypothetical protein
VKRRKRDQKSALSPAPGAEAAHEAGWVPDQPPLARALAGDQEQSELNPAPGSQAANIPPWMSDDKLPPPVCDEEPCGPNLGPSEGVVSIPAADGYHFSDDHPWSAKQQSALVTRLEELEESIRPA